MPTWSSMDGKTLLVELLKYSAEQGISDIHCSPEKDAVRFELRVRGLLELLERIPPLTYADFLRHVKYMSKLKMNVTLNAQDGQLTFPVGEGTPDARTLNVRVAALPSRFGETLTLRILDPKRGIVPLADLGFPSDLAEALASIARSANGLLLVTGPTGSGKTTTLYALLATLIGTHRHIVTLEDPIEYEIPGIVQSEVDPNHDYTFATGLRSILRHDPDIILVGEIRDLETAQTAIDASLTGHLVLSTLHTNSAIEAIPRLLSMGVSPYTFAPSLRGVLAQRLVRTLTPACRKTGAKCDPKDGSSYGGRSSIAELLLGSSGIQDLILGNESASAIEALARKEGFVSMRERGEALVKEGVTTMLEVERVTTTG